MSRTDKYTHTIVEYHSIDGMQLNIEHYVDKQSRQCYVIRIGPLWTCIQYVQHNIEHITLLAFKMTCKGASTLRFEVECMNTYNGKYR